MLFAVGLLFSAIAHADVYWANYGSGGGGIGHASSDGTGVNQNFISAPDSDGAGPLRSRSETATSSGSTCRPARSGERTSTEPA